jgi:hypothetical protein
MSAVIPLDPDDQRPPSLDEATTFRTCLTDPGALDTNAAILAMSEHHDCPPQCWPRRRAMHTLDTEFVATATPPPNPAPGSGSPQQSTDEARSPVEIDEKDRILAEAIRTHQQLTPPRADVPTRPSRRTG